MPTFTRRLADLIAEDFDLGLTPLDYDIFNETHRPILNRRIIDHYVNYEIGQETQSMFRFALNRKMREIMPLYNQRYVSLAIAFDPLQTMNYTDIANTVSDGVTHKTDAITGTNTNEETGTTSADATNTATVDNKARAVSSATPQVLLSGNEDYADGATDTISQSTNTGTSHSEGTSGTNSSGSRAENITGNQTDNVTGNISRALLGSQGVASELLIRYRATFLNVDMEVVSELETLFMQIWDNGDEYTPPGLLGLGFGYGF